MKKSRGKIRILIFVLGGLAAIGPFSIDMYLPGFAEIAGGLNTSMAMVGYSLTAYFFGICFGQLIYGPVTDRFGRKIPLLTGLAIYMISSIGCALVSGINGLIILRATQALGGCVGMVASRAVVRDVFPVAMTAKIFSSLMLVMGVAPIIAPTVGGIVTSAFGWRVIFWVLALFGAFMFICVVCFLDETKTPDPSVSLHPAKVFVNYFEVLKEADFLIYALAGSALSAGMLAYISGSPFVFMKLFGLSEKQFGWVYAVNSFGLISGSQLNHFLLKKFKSSEISFAGAIFQFITCLLLIAAAMNISIGKAPVFILIFLFLMMNGILNPNTTALALRPFKKSAGSASAMIGFIQMFTGAMASCLVSFFHDGTAVPMAAVMAVFSFLGLACLLKREFYNKSY